MGNIRLHINQAEPIEAPAEMWLTALLASLPEDVRTKMLENLEKIKKGQMKIIQPISVGMNGKILMPG